MSPSRRSLVSEWKLAFNRSMWSRSKSSSQGPAASPPIPRNAREFYARYKDWVDAENERVARIGLWNEEFRTW